MKSIFKIHQSTAKILQLVLRIVHPLNPPILSVHPSLLTLSFSSRARLSNSKKKKGESNEYRSQVIEKPITYPGSGDQLANHAVNTNHEIRYHERRWEVERWSLKLVHHIPGRERIRQGWCATRPGRKVRPLKQTLIPMVERVTTGTVAVT